MRGLYSTSGLGGSDAALVLSGATVSQQSLRAKMKMVQTIPLIQPSLAPLSGPPQQKQPGPLTLKSQAMSEINKCALPSETLGLLGCEDKQPVSTRPKPPQQLSLSSGSSHFRPPLPCSFHCPLCLAQPIQPIIASQCMPLFLYH